MNDKSKNKRNFKRKVKSTTKVREYKESRPTDDFDKSPRTNDLSWYTINDQLLRDAGSYSFNNPLGNTTRISELTEFSSDITYDPSAVLDRAVPGVMAIEYVPTIGPSSDNYSPINIAARSLFSMVRKTQSGKWNYEAPDLMKYIVALDSLYMMYAYLCRVYGVAKVYSVVNRYWPDAILTANHVDRDDVISHLSDLRYYINTLAHRLNTLCAPSGIKLFDRHFFMNVGVWKDANYDKAQLYVFVPKFLYKYEEFNTSSAPAELVPLLMDGSNASKNNKYTVQELISMTETLVQSLMASEDIGVISGDLFKAYGVANSHNVATIDENFEVYPVYDSVVLHQIHNTRFLGAINDDVSTHKIRELTSQDGNAGALVQSFDIPLATHMIAPVQNLAHVLDFDLDIAEINPGWVMEATRLTALGKVYNSSDVTRVNLDVYGSEIAIQAIIYTISNGGVVKVAEVRSGTMNGNQLQDHSCALSPFNLHPMLFATKVTVDKDQITKLNYIASSNTQPLVYDINNYTVIGKTGLRKLHEVAMLALLNMPYSGQYQ